MQQEVIHRLIAGLTFLTVVIGAVGLYLDNRKPEAPPSQIVKQQVDQDASESQFTGQPNVNSFEIVNELREKSIYEFANTLREMRSARRMDFDVFLDKQIPISGWRVKVEGPASRDGRDWTLLVQSGHDDIFIFVNFGENDTAARFRSGDRFKLRGTITDVSQSHSRGVIEVEIERGT